MLPRDVAELQRLLEADPSAGWRAFIEQYTPAMVALIERLGMRDRDDAMDLYTLVCERLRADDCARLRRLDPSSGSLHAWLAVVVRHVAADWVRSREGRRRLFGVVRQLDDRCQRVFQLFYWDDRSTQEIAEALSAESGSVVSVVDVLEALDTVHEALTTRHFSELVSLTARSRPPVSLDAELERGRVDAADRRPAVDASLDARDRDAALDRALAALPAEDAAIVRLHYLQGLALADVERALHVSPVTRARLRAILESVRAALGLVPAQARRPAPLQENGGRA